MLSLGNEAKQFFDRYHDVTNQLRSKKKRAMFSILLLRMGTILKTINSNLPVQPNAFRIYCRVTTDMIVSKLNFMRITPTVHQACLRSYSINIEYYPKYMFLSTLYIYILLSYILFIHWRWRCNVETVWLLYFIVYALVSQRIKIIQSSRNIWLMLILVCARNFETYRKLKIAVLYSVYCIVCSVNCTLYIV